MKLIAQVKLQPTPEQADLLKHTLEVANAAANWVSAYAWESQVFGQYDLHHALYYAVRDQFPLSAQMVVRMLAKVADAYQLNRQAKRVFHPQGSIAYDKRICRGACRRKPSPSGRLAGGKRSLLSPGRGSGACWRRCKAKPT